MKSPLFVSDPVMTPKAYQLETEMNGALSMACQRAAPYVAAARATSTKRLYGRAFKRWATWCEAMHANPLPASPEGLLVHLTGTKASAPTQTVAIPRREDELCATAALEHYLAATGISHGPLFRAVSKTGRLLERRLDATSVGHILKGRAGDSKFSPHALRAGFITAAARAKVPEHVIQRTSRHKSVEVLRGYIRANDPFDCAARHL